MDRFIAEILSTRIQGTIYYQNNYAVFTGDPACQIV